VAPDERAVARGQAAKACRAPELAGAGEKAAANGHRYLTMAYGLQRSTVGHVAGGRKAASLDGYFEALQPEELSQAKAVATDMWGP